MKTITQLMLAAALFGTGTTGMTAVAMPRAAEATEVAQGAPQGGDATAVLEAARKAVANLKAISYSAKLNGAVNNVASSAEVTLVRADAGGWKVWAKGENRQNPVTHEKNAAKPNVETATPVGFEVAYDGATGYSLNDAAKTVYQSSIKDELTLRNFFASQHAVWAVNWDMAGEKPFTFGANAVITLNGTTDVNGVNCNVVKVSNKAQVTKGAVMAHGGAVTTFYFGATDNIVRRIDRAIGGDTENGRNGEMTQTTVTFTDVKLDSAANAATFTPAIPDGYVIMPVGGAKQQADKNAEKSPSHHATGLLNIGTAAPDWTLASPDGKNVQLSSLKGKVVVLDFWATWCPPCKKAMPNVQKLHEAFAGKDVVVYGLSTWERDGDPAAFMKSNNYTYGLLVKADEVSKAYKVSGIPTFYVIGKDGKVLFNSVGFDENEFSQITTVINNALGK